jgi:MSHA biogenesis protein MshG
VPAFDYQGRNAQGQAVSGSIDAVSVEVVANQLLGRGVTPIKIESAKVVSDFEKSWLEISGQNKVKTEDLVILCRQMYTINKAGIPLIRGIYGLQASMNHPRLKQVLEAIGADLETGMQLSVAMHRYPDIFNNMFVSMVKVGEDSGQLERSFDQLSIYLERELETTNSIKTALRYPSFVLMALVIALGVVNVMVIPAFANMFKQFNAELPLMTRILIGTSDFFIAFWPHMLVFFVGGAVAWRQYLKTPAGALFWGEKKLRLPLVGDIIYRALMARYARSFSLMLKAGVPLSQSLDLSSRAVDNPYLEIKIQDIRQGVERGESLLRTHNASNMFSPLVLQMIAVGEESGQIDTLLEESAGFYEREVDYDLKSLSAKIEPIMIVVMAGFVLVLALGIFLPMWEMYNIQK